jgi:hypothetical protein
MSPIDEILAGYEALRPDHGPGATSSPAEEDGHLDDLPTNHSPKFLPPMQPTLRTGTEALVAAALAWLVT